MPEVPRQHSRCSERLPVDLRLANWDEFVRLYTRDISYGGLFIATDDPPDVFTAVEVTLHLPDGVGKLELGAEVVRSIPADCTPPGATAGMGLRITRITEEQRRLLGAWFECNHGAPATLPGENVGRGSVPSVTESEIPTVAPASVHEALQRKLASLVGDPFEMLGTVPSTDLQKLRRGYLQLAKKYHPHRWAHYEDAEITALTRRIGNILEQAYEQAKATLEGTSKSIQRSSGPATLVAPEQRQTHAELADFAAGVREVRRSPPGAPVDLQIAQALKHLALKHYDVAISALQRISEQAPENKPAKIWLRVAQARQLRQEGDEKAAVTIYHEILEIDPTHGEALKAARSGGRISKLLKKITRR